MLTGKRHFLTVLVAVWFPLSGASALTYGEQRVLEISGSATMQYSDTTFDGKFAPYRAFDLNLAPGVSYFFWNTIYLGANATAVYTYASSFGGTWFGRGGAFGGKTYRLNEATFLYAQMELGGSYYGPGSPAFLGLNYFYGDLTGGLKFVFAPAIINVGLVYQLSRLVREDPSSSSSWTNSMRLTFGLSVYF
jgi:hypothetical protein